MRNKWYVGGIVAVALLLMWGAVTMALGDAGALMAIVPGAVAVALIAGAWKVARADSFAPRREQRWDLGGKSSVHSWLKGRE